jgi:uncharacterized protein (TIGR00251 family)
LKPRPESTEDVIVLDVRIQTRCSQEGIERIAGGHVRIRVNAPPVDNAANKRLIEMLAREFRVAKSKVELISGATNRNKRLGIKGARRRPAWLDV